MFSKGSRLKYASWIGFWILGLITGLGFAGTFSTGASEELVESVLPSGELEGPEVIYEVTSELIILQAETEGVQVARSPLDLEQWEVESLPPGEAVAFRRDQQMSFFSPVGDCYPSICPTPKPIPVSSKGSGLQKVPGSSSQPSLGGVGVFCKCKNLVDRQQEHCKKVCKGVSLEIRG